MYSKRGHAVLTKTARLTRTQSLHSELRDRACPEAYLRNGGDGEGERIWEHGDGCRGASNRSEMHICMSNCLWSWVSWHILTSRGRSHMFLAWSQIFLLLWIILNRLSVFHVFDFKPLDVKFAIKLWSKNSWFQKRLSNCEKLSFDFIAFVIAFLNCFNFKEIKSLEAEFYLI